MVLSQTIIMTSHDYLYFLLFLAV